MGETGEAGQKQENTNTWNERTLQKHKETSAYFFHGEGECDNARSHDIVRDVHDGPSNGRPRVGFMFAVVRNEEFLHFLTSERSTNMHLYFSRPAKALATYQAIPEEVGSEQTETKKKLDCQQTNPFFRNIFTRNDHFFIMSWRI